MNQTEDYQRLLLTLRKYSVKYGDFVLASGKRSKIYLDVRLTALRAKATPLIGRLFIAKFQKRGWQPSAIGGLTMGADPIVTAISRESLECGLEINGFLVRKEIKTYGRQRHIEGLTESENKQVVIVEDVCTTGNSTLKAIGHARDHGLKVLGAICLVDREEGGQETVENAECPFDRIFTMSELTTENEI